MITNKINNKKYIGQTINTIQRRWSEHNSPSSDYCRILKRALNKYGKDNFTIEEIARASSIEELNYLEEKFIKEHNTLNPNGYNLLAGGRNKKHHPETRIKMSISKLGKKVPKLCMPRGKYSKEHCENISKAKKGKSNSLLGRKKPFIPSPARRKKVRAIGFKEFESVKSAAEFFNCTHNNIVACLKGRRPLAQGYRWEYV